MGIRDDLRKSLGSGLGAASGWLDDRRDNRRMAEFDDRINKAAKAARADGNGGNHELKVGKDEAPIREPKAIHFDPFDMVAAMGYRERPSALTFTAMEMIGRGTPVIADIIGTRVKQVSMFCDIPEDRHSPGFRVRSRDWRNKTPTKAMKKESERLERLLLHTGQFDPEKPAQSVSLREFATITVADSLMFDQVCFEKVPDRKGRPAYLAIVDPGTIRLLDPGHRNPGDPFCVQVVKGAIVESFLPDELAFCVRNPRSGINSYGYGTAEIETLVREITGFLWSMDYNRRFFTNGSATKGILNFKGTVPDKHLQAFRRQWYAMVSGVSNAWRTPITNAEELQWINMQMSNRDMEYSAWMDFLIKICCARYNIATEEVNFSYGNTGQSQSMGTAPIEEKLKASKDLGLRPLVRWFFNMMNMHFIQQINPDFEVIPVGLEEKGVEAETDLLQKQTKIYMTVDEARAQVELEPLPDDLGKVILDPTWLQNKQGLEAAAQEEEMGDEGFDEEEDEPQEPYSEDGFTISDDDGDSEFDISDDDAIKSERPGRRLSVARYTIDL